MKKFLILFAVASVALSCGSKDVDVDDFEMVYIKGGTFIMGATAEQGKDVYGNEKPAHSVTLSDYYIGKYEVTQAQWRAVMGSNPSYYTGDNNPVEKVSWDDIQQFITKLNTQTGKQFRLPTEAEWEYAARGGNQSKGYKYSGSNNISEVAWYDDNSDIKTYPVGQKTPNELGICDMSGNVWEWCLDWYGSYGSDSQTNPIGPSSGFCRVLRGGSWSRDARDCRVSFRSCSSADVRYDSIGFRLACSDESASQTTASHSHSGSYKIGDIVTINGIKGVVFQTSPVVKIVSVSESTAQWSTVNQTTNATDKYNGANNLAWIKHISDWRNKYPAFKWCADLGEGWYLPAQNELKAIYNQKDVINKTLSANGFNRLGSKDSYSCIWSSSEDNYYYACSINCSNGDVGNDGKGGNDAVRAVLGLDAGTSSPKPIPSSAFTNIVDFDMVYVQGGTFTMGATAEQGQHTDRDEKPAHSVTLSDYYIGKYEVTQAQWRAIMGKNPSYFTGDNNPVEQVSWDDIQEFITKLNEKTGKQFRLPTEAEWEYAARGGNQSKGYKYSGSNNISKVAWYDDNSGIKTHPVGQKTPNELGICDMSGNVWELCQDWYGSYGSDSQTNPMGPSSGSGRVLRGGSWNYCARSCRVFCRFSISPGDRDGDCGFRLACSVEPTPQTTATTTFQIGDFVTINGIIGVVFQTSPVVKIVSVAETKAEWGEFGVTTNATDRDNGKANMTKIKSISGWQSKYPAFKWCADLGEGWYLPAQNELKAIYNQKDTINKSLSANGFDRLSSKDSYSCIWSSSEYSNNIACSINFSNGDVGNDEKGGNDAVRAVLGLDAGTSFPKPIPSSAFTNIVDFDMAYVQGGTFTMGATAEQGDDAYDWEKPTHSVTLSDYYIGKCEVTQAQWRAVMGSNPSRFTGDNNPVENVSWDDIQEFITKLNEKTGKKFRLPTEAEWEYAARGGNKSKGYKYSGSNNISEVAWYDDNSDIKTYPVGQKTPNELGIYDMTGNVDEWCQDWYDSYSSSSQTNPTGPSSGSYRVMRGGSWSCRARDCRVSYRDGISPGYRYGNFGYYGFRLACSVE